MTMIYCFIAGVDTQFLSILGREILYLSSLLLITHPAKGLMQYTWFGVKMIHLLSSLENI